MDYMAENLGLNRKVDERLSDYVSRVLKDNILTETNCLGMEEMIFCKYQHLNAELNNFDSTFYFAHATGERKRERAKAREVFSEPRKILKR